MAALTQLWSMRSPLNLVGTSIHMTQAMWNNRLGGTGAGIDSFYEYLLKAYILFGKSDSSSTIIHVTLPGMHSAMQMCVGALNMPFCASKVASLKHFDGCCGSLSSEFLPVEIGKTVACWLNRSWVCYRDLCLQARRCNTHSDQSLWLPTPISGKGT